MTARARQWYRFENSADPTVAEIFVIDIIGDWIDELINEMYGMKATLTAKAFIDTLAKLPDGVRAIKVRINSPGGDVFAAVNIANALRDQQISKGRTVETIIDGLAASAASIIAMAGKTVTMADNALMMVHNPWSFAIGNAADMRQAADVLDTVRKALTATYQWHSELTTDEINALLDAETWMDADQAIANGFATAKVDGLQAAASIDPLGVAKMTIPEQFKARVEALLHKEPPAPTPAAALEVVRACNAGGCPELAEGLIAAQATIETVTETVATTKASKAEAERVRVAGIEAAATREREIRAACRLAKQADLADSYVQSGMTADQVRAQLAVWTAKLDKIEIDNKLGADHGARPKPVIDTAKVYEARNRPKTH
jgi:ATP-dependent protease ClpP protease subunit